MNRTLTARLLLFVCLAIAPGLAAAQEGPAIPEPEGFVNDHAGVLSPGDRARLEAFLDQVKRKTGAEIGVLIVPTTAPLDPGEYKVRVFEKWGLGRRGEDDGLLLLVAMEERQARFETGYGLEGVLPDGYQSRVFRQVMQPRFREGDFAGGITEGLLRMAYRIAQERGVTLEWDGSELRYSDRPAGERVPLWVPILIFVVVAVLVSASSRTGRGRRRGGRAWWHDGPGGYGGWGGGFGGGAGSGGGGSFGGFGGGASGGGGGGGSW